MNNEPLTSVEREILGWSGVSKESENIGRCPDA